MFLIEYTTFGTNCFYVKPAYYKTRDTISLYITNAYTKKGGGIEEFTLLWGAVKFSSFYNKLEIIPHIASGTIDENIFSISLCTEECN